MNTWTIPKRWAGQTAFVIGGGPSVAHQRPERLQGRNVIVINSSYEVAPFAQYLFFGDHRWHEEHKDRPDFIALRQSGCEIVTVSDPANGFYLRKFERITPSGDHNGLTLDGKGLSSQRTSFQGAINLAVMLGAKRLVLLGLDGQRNADGVSHHHTPHKWPLKPGNVVWEAQKTQLCYTVAPLKALGVETFNTSADSTFDYWPYRPLEDFLDAPRATLAPRPAGPVQAHPAVRRGPWDRGVGT